MSSDRASGANHAIYAQFMAQSSMANKGRKVGLLQGAGTRMALWFCNDACVRIEAGSDGNNPSTEVYRFDCE